MTVVRLSAKQVAERLGCSIRLVRDHIATGSLPAINIARDGARKPRFRIAESDLLVFEQRRAVRVA